jgi:hypothetical protein
MENQNSFLSFAKNLFKKMVPETLIEYRRHYLRMKENRKWDQRFSGAPTRDIFSSIYEDSMWSDPSNKEKFYSGLGSHDPQIVMPYIQAIRAFLERFPSKPNVVDLGCGDFNVGRQIRQYCQQYIACDIVPSLIERNKSAFAELNVKFQCLDLSEDALPDGEIVFVRQVLQHLSNAQIARFLTKTEKYRWLVVTEHLPSNRHFKPNQDISAGPGTRMGKGIFEDSGVVLTAAPFNLQAKSEQVICEVTLPNAVVRTIAYQLH